MGNTGYLAKVSLLAAIAAVIMFIETPLPLFPAFLKLDFSELPALIAAFSLGPAASVYVGLIKNLLHLPSTQTGGVGEAANFLVGCAFAVPAGWIYGRNKTRQNAATALLAGGLTMTLAASLLNYWLLIPLYLLVLGIPDTAIVAMGHAANSHIIDLPTFVAYGIVPFNLIKASVLSGAVLLIYKRVLPLLHK
ncbi:MAG: ECF transporter S component [Sporomusaceae bacterium]|nr:ECF transporter S component [Sporomusaceae bacterium]